ncbi:outer membrane homotrimeric porin [Pseudodesulfovibrio cashew]|uniref:Outer membrane homotrimeric porin n=1 Tax=Pseudodesulfovibrio cashew TaxID=2678688 RepID=A0A6I6JJT8_9BACT|nr:outer membrane homotrimeric porin [Pseudodesulfovibrio cashew]QGY40613.1 outer membrane homotrimeric porin [Pseudodesulfovibrio cashew]
MKRLIMLAVLCAFVLSAAAASAADFKASGQFVNDAMWQSNWNFKDKGAKDNDSRVFNVKQRIDIVLEFIASENLKAVMYTRTQGLWGSDYSVDGDTYTGATGIGLRRAYIDFNWPDTSINIKSGYMGLSLPTAIGGGSFILDGEIAGAMVSGPITDNVSFLAGYARAFDENTAGESQVDAYVAALPMAFDGFSLQPFAMYANVGKGLSGNEVDTNLPNLASLNATSSTTTDEYDGAYWLGAAFTMDLFDPFVLKADLNYGKVQAKNDINERSGWLFDMALEYTGLDYMTPEVFFAYTTGEDGNASKGSGDSERMPFLSASNWALGSFFFGGDTFLQGSMGDRSKYLGFWALGASLKDIQSFAEGLTHTATIIYAKGTNDKEIGTAYSESYGNVAYGSTLTEKDSLIEVDFNTYYKLYDEMTIGMELGYLNLDTKESVWGADQKGGDAWKISTGLVYKF